MVGEWKGEGRVEEAGRWGWSMGMVDVDVNLEVEGKGVKTNNCT